jgi:hypothetical protein
MNTHANPDVGKNAFERLRFKAFGARNAALEGKAPSTNSLKTTFCALFAQQNAFFAQTYFFLRLVMVSCDERMDIQG